LTPEYRIAWEGTLEVILGLNVGSLNENDSP